jgi:hypothetical protein
MDDKGNAPAIIAFGRLTIADAFQSIHISLFRCIWRVSAAKALENRIEAGILCLHNHVTQDFANYRDLSLSPEDYHLAALGQELERLPSSNLKDLKQMDMYKGALIILRTGFALRWQQGEALSAKLFVFTLVGSVSRRYLELLSVLKPVALVSSCYMCVLL